MIVRLQEAPKANFDAHKSGKVLAGDLGVLAQGHAVDYNY
jgi:hypothetical protein